MYYLAVQGTSTVSCKFNKKSCQCKAVLVCILGVFYAILSEYNKEVLDKWLKNRASQESADNICILKNLTESMFLEDFVSCRCNSE